MEWTDLVLINGDTFLGIVDLLDSKYAKPQNSQAIPLWLDDTRVSRPHK